MTFATKVSSLARTEKLLARQESAALSAKEKNRTCPMCGKLCRVATDGKSGFCKTNRKRWRREMLSLKDLKPGPIQHRNVDPFLLDIMGWTYKIVGRYSQPTRELWELGFMRDLRMADEIVFWHRLAFSFITYHDRRGLALRDDDTETKLIGAICAMSSGSSPELPPKELAFVQECMDAPVGWDEEVKHIQEIAAAKGDSARWTPPARFASWSN